MFGILLSTQIEYTKKENTTKNVHINNNSTNNGKIRNKIPLLTILTSSTIVINISWFIGLDALVPKSQWVVHMLYPVHSKDAY